MTAPAPAGLSPLPCPRCGNEPLVHDNGATWQCLCMHCDLEMGLLAPCSAEVGEPCARYGWSTNQNGAADPKADGADGGEGGGAARQSAPHLPWAEAVDGERRQASVQRIARAEVRAPIPELVGRQHGAGGHGNPSAVFRDEHMPVAQRVLAGAHRPAIVAVAARTALAVLPHPVALVALLVVTAEGAGLTVLRHRRPRPEPQQPGPDDGQHAELHEPVDEPAADHSRHRHPTNQVGGPDNSPAG